MEYLFRGKRCDNGKWCYGYYVEAKYYWHEYGKHKDWIICNAYSNGGWFALGGKHAVVSDTVGMYTNRTDINGKKIFTGDIVRVRDTLDRGNQGLLTGVVGFSNCSFVIETESSTHYRWQDYEVEVIGNIHDKLKLRISEEQP